MSPASALCQHLFYRMMKKFHSRNRETADLKRKCERHDFLDINTKHQSIFPAGGEEREAGNVNNKIHFDS